ncbi:transposon Tf2-1 polyprotein isoform X1 [Cucumis melo var. makuwa]|uniref:Transposon Tf2-1 polyprotein isoform X1 n=1 Tax=Cucumis melo var. makuwa TaxID=1194695 RepID=A0A5A7UR70_CUCMM|nr:transposon Tf2-1 polyprotein isoform X1 [Cucumis melo var. makuwa]
MQFCSAQMEYLGHIISGEGVEVDPEKIKSITKWPKPMNIKEVRGFLGLTGYYRRFVQNYGAIAAPLTQLLKKGGTLLLKLWMHSIDLRRQLLIQARRPIAYYSHALPLGDRAWPVYERELMVVGYPTQYQKWIAKLLGYSFEVVYKPCAENRAADALSRIPTEVELKGLSVPVAVDLELIKKEVHQDPKFQKLMAELRELEDWQGSKFLLQNDVLKYKDRTYKRVSSDLYWEGMEVDIKKHCEECLICQRNKSLALSPTGLLVRLEIPQARNDISMDFVEGLPKASGFEVILVAVDRLSKYSYFLPLKHPLPQNWWSKYL